MDVDRRSVKAVQLDGRGSSYSLQHVGYHRLPPGTIVEGEVADHDLLAAELREFWSSHGFKNKEVYLGVSNQQVIVRLLDFPRMDPKELANALEFEAQDHIPMPLEEAYMDHVVLGPQEEDSDLDRILIVAAQRDMIYRYSSAARAAGLRPVGMDVKSLAISRSMLPEDFFDEGAILLLDIGSELTNLVVCQNGNPTLARFTPGGADYFSRSISDAADLSEEEAEEQLSNPQVSLARDAGETAQMPALDESGEQGDAFDPAFLYDVRRGLEDAAQALAEDVQRSIDYHHSQPGAREISQVFISGEGALVSGLDSYLGELLMVPTFRGNPLQKIVANRSNVSDEQLNVMEPVLAVALGLALEE